VRKEYSTDQIAKLLNVNRATVCDWINKDKLKSYKLPGGTNRVTRESLEEFMKSYDIPLSYISDGDIRILIVDDDPTLLVVLKKYIEKIGRYTVHTADNGYEAGIETGYFVPQVIILDIGLPDIDGREVARYIYSDKRFRSSRIIGISGILDEEEVEDMKNQNFSGFLQKPFSPDELMDLIVKSLKTTPTISPDKDALSVPT